jgi:hypothetical protein
MTIQEQTTRETKRGTKEGQPILSRAAKDQLDHWKSRVRHRKYRKGDAVAHIRHLQVRIKHAGDEGWFNLGTENRTEAARKAVTIYGFVTVNGWDAANARFKPKPEKYSRSPTLGEFFAAVREHSDLSDRTFTSYCRKFRSIVASIFGIRATKGEKFGAKNSRGWRARVDAIELASVTPQRIDAWRKAYVGRQNGNHLAQKRARHSADSAIRCSKALFGKKVCPKLQGFPLPSPLPFEGVSVGQVHNPYESDINPHALTADASRELRDEHPEAFKISQ